MNRVLSPDFWLGVFSVSAIIGIILSVIGMAADVSLARTVGLVLIAPIVLVGVLLAIVVIPVLIIASRRQIRSGSEEHDSRDSRDESKT